MSLAEAVPDMNLVGNISKRATRNRAAVGLAAATSGSSPLPRSSAEERGGADAIGPWREQEERSPWRRTCTVFRESHRKLRSLSLGCRRRSFRGDGAMV